MKKLVLSAVIVLGFTAAGFAQGTVVLNNLFNTGFGTNGAQSAVYSSSVTSNGMIFTTDVADQKGTQTSGGSTLEADDMSFALWGASTAGGINVSSTPVVSGFVAGDNINYGQITRTGTITIPGTTSATPLYLDLLLWEGNSATLAQAQAGTPGVYFAYSGAFLNPAGGGITPASSLISMPDMQLITVPEPATMALIGLGSLSLMLFRRKIS
jgi:hypothetical protein